MSKPRTQDFLRGSDAHQARIVTIAAGVFAVVVAVIVASVVWIYPLFRPDDSVKLTIDTPSVGPAVAAGTKVIMHGAEIGEVDEVAKTPSGDLRMSLSLRPEDIVGLTDRFDLDFRPANYFGITAVNLVNNPGGNEIRSGAEFQRTPTGDFTMSTMIEKGSIVVDGTLTDTMISTLDKMIRYADGLTPLIETGVTVADRIAQTQQQIPSELLTRMNDIVAVMPDFAHEALQMVLEVYNTKFNVPQADGTRVPDEDRFSQADHGLDLAANQLFGLAGALLKSHDAELVPVVGLIQEITDALPGLLAADSPAKIAALVDRYDSVFTDNGSGKTLNLDVRLDTMPSIAGALQGINPLLPTLEMPR